MHHKRSLEELAKADPILGRIIRLAKLKSLKARENHFESLVVSIINQQLSTKAADTIEKRFRALFGKIFPKPSAVLKMADGKMRAAGLSFQKISYIKNLAKAVEQGSLDFKKFGKMPDEEIIADLILIKGIGRWTAEMFLMFSLGRPDVFSHGDLGLRNAIKKLYNIDPKLHTKKLQKLIETWKPHRTLASRHLWASLNIT